MQRISESSGSERTASWDVRATGGDVLVSLSGEIDMSVIGSIRDGLHPLIDGVSTGSVTMDLHDVTFIDSSGIHLLVKIREAVEAGGGRFFVGRPSQPVRRVLDIVGAEELFEILE